jgi:hypothetical protein
VGGVNIYALGYNLTTSNSKNKYVIQKKKINVFVHFVLLMCYFFCL